jgi:hypothetical protein
MTDLITDTFNAYYKNEPDYWTPIKYIGKRINVLSILKISAQLKNNLVSNVTDSLVKDYSSIEPDLFRYIISTTFITDGILLTPLEAIDYCKKASSLFCTDSVLSTYAYPQTIRLRIKNTLQAISPFNKEYSLFNYLSLGTICKYYKDIKNVNIAIELVPKNILDVIYETGNKLFIKYYVSDARRDKILSNLTYDFYLYLKNSVVLSDTPESINLLDYSKIHLDLLLSRVEVEVIANYYEPLIFTRYQTKDSVLTPNSLKFIENADIFSKITRIESMRRRSILQDSRYIITRAFESACRRIKNES